MTNVKNLGPTIAVFNPGKIEMPITAIAGWKPSKEQLVDIGYPSLPDLPAGRIYLIGADYLEWKNTKCSSANLYIVDDSDLLFSTSETCFEKKIHVYHPGRAQIFHSGFNAVVSDQEPSPDQLVAKESSLVGEPDDLSEDEVLAEAYADSEISISGNINRAFDLLGWNPVTRCVCGIDYGNNCAHYLCNALIRAGFPAPSGGSNEKCPRGRLIRAMDVLKWCQQNKKAFSSGHRNVSSGTWIVYQKTRGPQHVCMHKEYSDKYERAGTGDFADWPTQWHYRF